MNPLRFALPGRAIFFPAAVFLLLSLVAATGTQILNESILYSFSNAPDGNYPSGGLIAGQDGSLYGITGFGGTNGYGTLFQINRNGAGYRLLHTFDTAGGTYGNSLLQGTNGLLYGATSTGGSNFVGTIFKINTNGTGYTQLHALSSAEGIFPYGLFQASNGVLYGTAPEGGISNAGTAFRLNADGSGFQILHQFTNSPDGSGPSGIILGSDNELYGTTSFGGISNAGIVFRMTTNGNNYTLLRNFTNSPDGNQPTGYLIEGKDGALYGTTSFGGSAYIYGGILFKLNLDGSGYTILHNFPSVPDDGLNPEGLTQGSDGMLYCVTLNNGQYGNGMVFRSDTNGNNFTVLYSLSNSPPDGSNPTLPLVEAGDGAFYGTANHGGTYAQGIVFRLAPPLLLSLRMSTAAGTNTAILSWPAWASDYGVRSSPGLGTNANWTTLGPPVTAGNTLFTTNQSTAPHAFYRLQSPP